MTIDKKKIHAAIRQVINQQKEIKARNKKYREDYRFQGLSYEMTILCSILAQAKGRTHIRKLTKRFGTYGFYEPVETFTPKHQDKMLNGHYAKQIIKKCLADEGKAAA